MVLPAALAKIEEKVKHAVEENGEIHEAISWYNRVLGFQIEGGYGLQPQSTSCFHQDSSVISMSGPALSVSTDRSESSTKKNEHHMPLQQVNGPVKEVNHRSKSSAKTNENKIYDGRFNRLPRKPTQIFNCRSPPIEAKK